MMTNDGVDKHRQSCKVLIVDDEEGLRSILRSFLSEGHYKIIEADGGYSAIEILKNQHVDVVVTDIKMPKGTGLELLSWIKSNCTQSPSVVLISGLDDISTPVALDAGAEDLLLKPIDWATFLDLVTKAKTKPIDRWQSTEPSNEVFSYNIELKFKSLESALRSGAIELGQGGMFLQMQDRYPLSFERIRFTMTFEEGALKILAGDGFVRWARPHTVHDLKNGIGIEFRYIAEECRAEMSRLLVERRIASFIPLGRVS